MTVITLTNASPSLRGSLTKWMQEISTGVYVGHFNSRIREKLWERVKENIGNGQATISYTSQNEQGYIFETLNTDRRRIEFDGIHLVFYPIEQPEEQPTQKGFSDAYKHRRAKIFSKSNKKVETEKGCYVVLDIETDGLDLSSNKIIEIGAIKVTEEDIEKLNILIDISNPLPSNIKELTGITDILLKKEGIPIEEALGQLLKFIENYPIIGYSVDFDINFINAELQRLEKQNLRNSRYDLLKYVKKDNMFLDSYKLNYVLKAYGIEEEVPHRALLDAELIKKLAEKVNGFLGIVKKTH